MESKEEVKEQGRPRIPRTVEVPPYWRSQLGHGYRNWAEPSPGNDDSRQIPERLRENVEDNIIKGEEQLWQLEWADWLA